MGSRRVLSRGEARDIYDRIGRWQDTQAFYEAPALDELIAHGAFNEGRSVFEVGCGTGRLAECLLRERCPSETRYEGVDLSATMVEIARERLTSFGERATVRQTDGTLTFERAAGSQERVVATYLLDLLSREDARTLLRESHRLLAPDGRLCLAGLTWGRGPVSKGMSALWNALYMLRPEWVGGCRPLRTQSLIDDERWHERHHGVVTGWGVPSEVLILAPV
jgi:SAM-dependent methyltransferase